MNKTLLRNLSLVVVLLLFAVAPSVHAADDGEASTSFAADLATTVQSWIDALAEIVLPATESETVDEAGVDIEPAG